MKTQDIMHSNAPVAFHATFSYHFMCVFLPLLCSYRHCTVFVACWALVGADGNVENKVLWLFPKSLTSSEEIIILLILFLVLGCPSLRGKSWWILLVIFSSSLLWCPTPGAKAQDHFLHSQVPDRRGSSGNFCFPSPVQCLSETCLMLFHSHLPFLTSATSFQWGPSCWSVSSPHRKAQLHSCILKKARFALFL